MLPLDIVGPNTAYHTLLKYRDIVENIKTETKLNGYLDAVLNGGRYYNPSRPKRNSDYKKKWCN